MGNVFEPFATSECRAQGPLQAMTTMVLNTRKALVEALAKGKTLEGSLLGQPSDDPEIVPVLTVSEGGSLGCLAAAICEVEALASRVLHYTKNLHDRLEGICPEAVPANPDLCKAETTSVWEMVTGAGEDRARGDKLKTP